jgi:hypothetical protein
MQESSEADGPGPGKGNRVECLNPAEVRYDVDELIESNLVWLEYANELLEREAERRAIDREEEEARRLCLIADERRDLMIQITEDMERAWRRWKKRYLTKRAELAQVTRRTRSLWVAKQASSQDKGEAQATTPAFANQDGRSRMFGKGFTPPPSSPRYYAYSTASASDIEAQMMEKDAAVGLHFVEEDSGSEDYIQE